VAAVRGSVRVITPLVGRIGSREWASFQTKFSQGSVLWQKGGYDLRALGVLSPTGLGLSSNERYVCAPLFDVDYLRNGTR